jgi:hypothetical protein
MFMYMHIYNMYIIFIQLYILSKKKSTLPIASHRFISKSVSLQDYFLACHRPQPSPPAFNKSLLK